MKPSSIVVLVLPLCVAGCVTTRAPRPDRASSAPPLVAIAPLATTRVVEVRYEVRGYRDPTNPSVRHEAHAVYRRTVVPLTATEQLETVPRDAFSPASVIPLSPSAELNAELGTQRKITAELRAAQAALAETADKMQSQYAVLVRQSTDAAKLREQLEAERSRLQSTPAPPPAIPPGPAATPTEAKW